MIHTAVTTTPNTETLSALPLHILLLERELDHFIKYCAVELQTHICHRASQTCGAVMKSDPEMPLYCSFPQPEG